MRETPDSSPKVFGAGNIAVAVLVHVLFFALCYWAAIPMTEKKVVIPIDLTLVVHENLDGAEDEPPPMEPPKPEPPKPEPPKPEPPKPEPPKPEPPKPEPPKPDPPKPPDAVVKETPKTNEVAKVEQPKPPEKKPEPPKKLTREERLKQMRAEAKIVKNDKPSKPQPNGRTGPKTLSDEEIRRRLNMGYRAGRTESLAADESQLCISLIYKTFYDKWNSPAYSPGLREMVLEVRFDSGGRVVSTRLVQSSGDASVDRSVSEVGSVVKYVAGLTPAFLRENPVVNVRFKVAPQ